MYDLLVIGGGINGVGIARDAAGRGLKVLLCEKNDLASATSSASSKLIHGGVRYLESYEFGLVRKALAERETLLRIAPHIVRPMRFVLPVDKGMRPAWMLRIGLFLYDHLARRAVLPGTISLNLKSASQGQSLNPYLSKGFEYSDCWVDDARLVVLNAVDAAERGAEILTYTACTALDRKGDHWEAQLKGANGALQTIGAKLVVNAAGPWVDNVRALTGANAPSLRLVKGSHIVTKELYEGDHAYIFQTRDGRVVFAAPFADGHTMIGTTDIEWRHDASEVKISDEETAYLCGVATHYFKSDVKKEDVLWSFSGVRPLFDDKNVSASNVTRDYVFDLDTKGGAPILSVFGGKLTTYRVLAEDAMDRIRPLFPELGQDWTETAFLPGGDNHDATSSPWIPTELMQRWQRAYGSRADGIIGKAASLAELGRDFGHGLYEAEVRYLMAYELARTADDILWRRTKLGLRFTQQQTDALTEWLKSLASPLPGTQR